MTTREIIRAGAWIGFRELVAEMGGDPLAILAAARIAPADIENPERYLPLRAFLDSQEIAAARLNRPDFGLQFGARDNLASLGAIAIATLNAPTTREAIETCARYIHVQDPALKMTLSPMPRGRSDFLGFHLELRNPIPAAQNAERMIASAHRSLARIGGPDYQAKEVWFSHAPLSSLRIYRKMFGVTPSFNKPLAGLAIARDQLDAFRPGRSPLLREIAESFLRSLGPPRQVAYSERVANTLLSLIQGGDATPAHAANALGVHERTLQRRLKAEGTSFEQIKDDLRREQAEAMLAQRQIPISHIALTLGYADSSTFTRSSRRWFGAPPSQVRARLIASGAPTGSMGDPSRINPLVVARRLQQRRSAS